MATVYPLPQMVESIADHPKYFTDGVSDEEIAALQPLVDAGYIWAENYYAQDDGRWTNLYMLMAPLDVALAYIEREDLG